MQMKRSLSILGVGLAMLLSITGCAKEKLEDYDNNEVIVRESNALAVSNEECRIKDGAIELSARVAGMAQIWSYEATEPVEVTISCMLKPLSEKAKIVLIDPNGNVTTLAEAIKADTYKVDEEQTVLLTTGKHRIKVVAVDNTTLELSLSVPVGTFTSLWGKGNVTQNPITDTYNVAAEELFPHRTASLKDAEAVDAMMQTLRFPDTFAYREAETSDGITTIVFDTNSDDRSLYVGEEYQWPFYKNALYIFSLAENAQQVIFHIYDEDDEPLEIIYKKDAAASVMGEDFFTKGETPEGYAALIKAIDDSFNTWDLTIPEQPNL